MRAALVGLCLSPMLGATLWCVIVMYLAQPNLDSQDARHPGDDTFESQYTFEAVGIVADPFQILMKLPFGQVERQLSVISNPSSVALTDLEVEVTPRFNLPVPENVSISLQKTTLQPGERTSLIITSNSDELAEANLAIRVVPGNYDIFAPFVVALRIIPSTAVLKANVARSSAKAVRGTQTLVSFEVTNQGDSPTGPLSVAVPEHDVLDIAVEDILPSLDVEAGVEITLALTPPLDAELGTLTGSTELTFNG